KIFRQHKAKNKINHVCILINDLLFDTVLFKAPVSNRNFKYIIKKCWKMNVSFPSSIFIPSSIYKDIVVDLPGDIRSLSLQIHPLKSDAILSLPLLTRLPPGIQSYFIYLHPLIHELIVKVFLAYLDVSQQFCHHSNQCNGLFQSSSLEPSYL